MSEDEEEWTDEGGVYGNPQEESTFEDFRWDEVEKGLADSQQVNPQTAPTREEAREVLVNWCSYLASDLRLDQIGTKVCVFAKFVGLPVSQKLLPPSSDAIEAFSMLARLRLTEQKHFKMFLPILSWMTQGKSRKGPRGKRGVSQRAVVFIYRVEPSFLPFSTHEEVGIWIGGVTKPRVQHLINELHISLRLPYKSNKAKPDAPHNEVFKKQVANSKQHLIDLLNAE